MIDLHTHSTASDGTLSPAALVRAAYRAGVRLLALSDHDTFDGIVEARETARDLGICLLPAVEVTTTLCGRTCHILAYFQDFGLVQRTAARLEELRRVRENRLVETCERLRKLGVDILPGDVRKVAGRAAIHRPHIARALMQQGFVTSTEEAFRRFLRDGGPAHVKFDSPDSREEIWRLREEGAYTSLAHAALDRFDETHIRTLAAQGLDAVEVYHSEHSPIDRQRMKAICERLDLGMTGGSDYHGDTGCRFCEDSSDSRGVPEIIGENFLKGVKRAMDLAPSVRKQHGVQS